MKTKNIYQLLKSGVFIVALQAIMVQSLYSQDKKDTLILNEVVVTGLKLPLLQGTITKKIEVIDKKDMNMIISVNRNIAEILFNRPGISVSALSRNDANWGTYGGIGPKYSTFMLQGLPIDAFVDPMTLDLAAIDRIEIQRGPASVIYSNYLSQDFAGNQSPLAGTVNLILKERFEKEATIFNTAYGSYNTLNSQFYHQGLGRNLYYFFGGTYEISDYTDYGIPNSWLNMHKNPEYKKSKMYGGMTWSSDHENQKFTLFVSKTLHEGDAGRVYRGFNHNYNTINTGYTLYFNKKIIFQAHAGLRSYDRSWQESHFNIIDSLNSNNGVVQLIVPAEAQITIKHGEKHAIIFGADYQSASYYTWTDPLVGYKSYGNKSTAMQSGIYAHEKLQFNKLILCAGVRYNFTINKITLINGNAPGQDLQNWSKLLYNGGIRYNLSNNLSLFANAGNSFMTPGLKSVGGTISIDDTIHSGQLPNPGLKPESGTGIDLGFDLSLPYKFILSCRSFNTVITNAIIDNVVRQSPSQSQSINAGQTNSTGIEAELKQNLSNSLKWFANVTYMKTIVKNKYDADQDGGTVPFSPEFMFNAGIFYSSDFGLHICPALNYNGGYYDNTSVSSRNKFVPGVIINLYVAQELLKNNNSKLSCFGQFYNLTNNQHEMPWQFRNTGFSFMAGLKAEF